MSHHSSSLRLFVAIYPPAETIRALGSALDGLNLGPRGRVPDDQIHMTVQFIGDTPDRELADVQESIERSVSGIAAFDLRPIRLRTLPEGPRPRLVAAETDAPAPLMELHRRLAQRLARNVRERDRFRPHMTLHRFKSSAPSMDIPLETAAFGVTHILLVRSILKPAGAEHAEVWRAALG